MTALKYRADIDGLRAIAVISVVLYHYGFDSLRGGFVGVDVFFVISGYLITGIIQREVEQGSFTFTNFFERRVRRIFPALFAMLATVFLAGLVFLLPSDLAYLGKVIIATLGFGSNILFWRQSGYFDPTSEFNPLLHTWSLSVEEQFYIGFPILLMLIDRLARRWIKPILFIVFVISFGLCIYFQPLRPTATFYLLPFRAWELLLGGLCAIGFIPAITNRLFNQLLAITAFALLICSVWLIEAGLNFPGWQAVIPAVATATLLYCGSQGETMVGRFLACKPMVFFGLISYSLYLWHWPLLIFTRYRKGMETLSTAQAIILAVVAILLAWFSYRWIEAPFRKKVQGSLLSKKLPLFVTAMLGASVLGAAAVLTVLSHGAPERVPPAVAQLDQARSAAFPNDFCNGKLLSELSHPCLAGHQSASRGNLILWGDSHAMVWSEVFDRIGRNQMMRVNFAFHSACPPLIGVSNPASPTCHDFNVRVFQKIKNEKPDTVVLIASWLAYSIPKGQYSLSDDTGRHGNLAVFEPALHRTIEAIRPYTSRVIIVGPTPGSPSSDPFFSVAMAEWHKDIAPPKALSLVHFRQRSSWFWRGVERYHHDDQLRLIDPGPWFCSTKECAYRHGKFILYRDGGHLSLDGADFVFNHFPSELLKITKNH